jgi:hypothetical protein
MRTRPASIATIVVAIGLALTTIGIARALPYTVGGAGDRSSIGADAWSHGTAVSPALVALLFVGILAAIAMRPTRGGRRAAAWLAVLGDALLVTGILEPAQRDLVLFGTFDLALTPLVYALHVGLIGLVLSSFGETRRADGPSPAAPVPAPTSATSVTSIGPVVVPLGAGTALAV